jgi:hypothetical protein
VLGHKSSGLRQIDSTDDVLLTMATGYPARFRPGRSSAEISAGNGHAAMYKPCHLIGLELGTDLERRVAARAPAIAAQ